MNPQNDKRNRVDTGGGDELGSHRESFRVQVRNYFLTGMIIVGPIGITLYVVWWFINLIDRLVKPLFDSWVMPGFSSIYEAWIRPRLPEFLTELSLPFDIPGTGLLMGIFLLVSIGALAANLFGRTIVGFGDKIMDRMPVVRNMYRGLKQIFETVLTSSNSSFQKVGVIEYPRQGIYSIVFVSTNTRGEIRQRFDADRDGLLSVFLPTTPNPTSGFLLFVPEKDVTILDMKVEEAAKMVISAGLVIPGIDEDEEDPNTKSGGNIASGDLAIPAGS